MMPAEADTLCGLNDMNQRDKLMFAKRISD